MDNTHTYRIIKVAVKTECTRRKVQIRTVALVLTFFLLSLSFVGHAVHLKNNVLHRPSTSAEQKACYVYNLSKLIDWPEVYRSGAFVIGYIGDVSGYNQFSRYINKKTIGSQRVYTTHVQSVQSLPACHVLFVDNSSPAVVKKVSDQLPNPNTLLISHCNSGLEYGATINLIDQDSVLRFELSEENAKRHQLFIGSTLRGLAIISEK